MAGSVQAELSIWASEMTAGMDAEFECEMSVGEAKFSSSSFLLRLSSVFSFILFLVFFALLSNSSIRFPSKSKMTWPV